MRVGLRAALALALGAPACAERAASTRPLSPSAPAVSSPAAEPADDASSPEHWLKKLDDPALRAFAIQQLARQYLDCISRSVWSRPERPPELARLIDKTVLPLTRTYVNDSDALDPRSRVELIRLLAQYRDARSEPALRKVFERFAQAPSTSNDDQDINWAAQATEALALRSLSAPLLQTFLKLRASSQLGATSYRPVFDALRRIPDPAWLAPLIQLLSAPMLPARAADPSSMRVEQDAYQTVESVVVRCNKDVSCYLQIAQDAAGQTHANRLTGTKAAYMVAVLGDEQARDALVAGIDAVTEPAVRYMVGLAIDHLSPHGSRVAAEGLERVIERNAKSPDREKSANDAPLKQVALRLRARLE